MTDRTNTLVSAPVDATHTPHEPVPNHPDTPQR